MTESLSVLPQLAEDQQNMRRYFEKPEDQLSVIMDADPVCLYLETTNRCNLLCTTCPRTFEELEPEADMSWELFTSIIDQYPKIARVVLHGVGEPMLVKELPRMIRYLKERGVYVLFNTNGTLLTKANGQALIDAGLDELRVSLDAAESSVFQMVRGKDMFDRIVTNVGNFVAMQRESHCLNTLRGRRKRFCIELKPSPASWACSSARRAPLSRRSASRSGRMTAPGRCAAVPGASCTSRPTDRRFPVASLPSPCADMTASPWATPPSRPCVRSGTAKSTRNSGAHC
jgi:organic radical activating enzyme